MPYEISPPSCANLENEYTAGSRLLVARGAIRAWRSYVNESDGTIRPLPDFAPSAVIVLRISSLVSTDAWAADTPKAGAAVLTECIQRALYGDVCGLNITATCVTDGAISFSNCSHLLPMSGSKLENPVMFPPG